MTKNLRDINQIRGFWCVTGDHRVVDAAASVGPDFICIDTQHGVALGSLDPSLFTVIAHYEVPGLVRVEAIDAAVIGRALDLGAAGVIVPQVDTAEEARHAVAATRYAPTGTRSYGMQTRRIDPIKETPYLVIQVETAGAVDQLEQISSVEGVDCLYIGPADLGLAIGGVPTADVNTVLDGTAANASELLDVFEAVIETGKNHGIATGVHCSDGVTARRAFEMGFSFIAVTSDIGLITGGLVHELEVSRSL